jgi:hypothetical protein
MSLLSNRIVALLLCNRPLGVICPVGQSVQIEQSKGPKELLNSQPSYAGLCGKYRHGGTVRVVTNLRIEPGIGFGGLAVPLCAGRAIIKTSTTGRESQEPGQETGGRSFVNHDVGGLDDCRDGVASLEAQALGGSVRDGGGDFNAAEGNDHFGHDVVELQFLDRAFKLVACGEHGGTFGNCGGERRNGGLACRLRLGAMLQAVNEATDAPRQFRNGRSVQHVAGKISGKRGESSPTQKLISSGASRPRIQIVQFERKSAPSTGSVVRAVPESRRPVFCRSISPAKTYRVG